MDSVTQAVLGGAIMGAIAGRKYGRKAVLAGAICGTLPDLDVVIDHGDAISNMVEHRGFSHSLIVLSLISPLIVWLLSKIKWFAFDFSDVRLHLAIWLALVTHPLLDAMTIYGTQLLWPLTNYPFGIGSVFIIDPLYTLPLLVCLIIFLIIKNLKILRIGLAFSTIYLAWSMVAQYHVTQIAIKSIDDDYQQIISLPTPFNTVLWRVLVMNNDGYRVGYYSLFDGNADIKFSSYMRESQLPDTNDVLTLKDFTKGFYGVIKVDNTIIMQDLRMGLEPNDYVFQYKIAGQMNGQLTPMPNEQYRVPRNTGARLNRVWNRIWDSEASI